MINKIWNLDEFLLLLLSFFCSIVLSFYFFMNDSLLQRPKFFIEVTWLSYFKNYNWIFSKIIVTTTQLCYKIIYVCSSKMLPKLSNYNQNCNTLFSLFSMKSKKKILYCVSSDGNEGDKFAIHSTLGKVYVAQKLDWEERSEYSLNISVTDGHNKVFTKVTLI